MSLVWSYFMVAKWCLRFRIGMFLSSGWLSFLASRFLVLLHVSPIDRDDGNGLSCVNSAKYSLSISAVWALSLNDRELCPLHPLAFMIPCVVSMFLRSIFASSCASNPVSASIVKIVAYFGVDADIILLMFSVVGMRGIFLSHLK